MLWGTCYEYPQHMFPCKNKKTIKGIPWHLVFVCLFVFREKTEGKGEKFHWDIWVVLALENWIFDFGRPFAAVRNYYIRSYTEVQLFLFFILFVWIVGLFCSALGSLEDKNRHTVEPQWLEHLRDHGNSFETWVVRATEGIHGTSSGSK